jgi:hypothetical protein
MSILKKVPNDIAELRSFIQRSDKYFYLAKDEHVYIDEDEDGVEYEVVVPRQLNELGYFSHIWLIPHSGVPIYKFKKNKEIGLTIGNSSSLFDQKLKTQGFAERLVYTDYPPAAGSVPLTYDDYIKSMRINNIQSMRINDIDGGRKKTRNRKNRKSKKTIKQNR